MPIYSYQCSFCGHSQDVLQKLSDKHLVICPQCSKKGFSRQLTAAGFVLKGSGWYVTDFKDRSKKESDAEATNKKNNQDSTEVKNTNKESQTSQNKDSISSKSSSNEKDKKNKKNHSTKSKSV
tara:strand:- start:32 stop:400 length:369 start_codon:yes stop_codon:yes gene_type:complete